MADYARKARYSQYTGAVSGSIAYDLDYLRLRPAPERRVERPIQRPEAPAIPRTRPVTRAMPRGRQAVAPGAMLGFVVAAVLAVFALTAQIRLTALSSETVSLERQLVELQVSEARLKIAYESAFNLTEIERYAIEELGMQKPRGDQIHHINGFAPDRAVIVSNTSSGAGGLMGRLSEFFGAVGELFG